MASGGRMMLAVAVAWLLLPSVAAAVMVQVWGVSGVVYRPLLSIVPQVAVQVDGIFAVNCCFAPSARDTVAGDTVTGGGVEDWMVTVTLAGLPPPLIGVAVTMQVCVELAGVGT